MANIQIKDLPSQVTIDIDDIVHVNDDGTNTDKAVTVGDFSDSVITVRKADNTQAIAATNDNRIMTPAKTKLLVDNLADILRDGDYGIGGTEAIAISDWDDIRDGGLYKSTLAAGQSNSPNDALAGWVGLVGSLQANNTFQLVWRAGGGGLELYHRFGTTTWTGWQRLWDSSNLVKTINSEDTNEGRVPVLRDSGGIQGLGAKVGQSPPNNDCDDTVVTGFYRCDNTTLNKPISNGGSSLITTVYDTNTYQQQIFLAHNSNRMFTRRKEAGIWRDWTEFYSDLTPNYGVRRITSPTVISRKGSITDFNISATSGIVNADVDLDDFVDEEVIYITKERTEPEVFITALNGNFVFPNGEVSTTLEIERGISTTVKLVIGSDNFRVTVLG